LKKLPEMAIKYITQLCSAILRRGFFPSQWKLAQLAQIIMIQKPGKLAELTELYRPINLLPVLSKLFKKLLFSRIKIIMENHGLILDHQFGFRCKHATTEQIHRIIKRINNDMKADRYCSAVFLDVASFRQDLEDYFTKSKIDFQLISKIVIGCYLLHRTFMLKYGKMVTQLKDINFGMPQDIRAGVLLAIHY